MKIFSRWHIITKLLAVNLVLLLVLGGLIVVVFLSFKQLEQMNANIVNQDVSQVIQNAQTGRILTRVFADASALIESFLKQKDLLQKEGDRLIKVNKSLVADNTTTHLGNALQQFLQEFELLLKQAAVLETSSQDLQTAYLQLEANIGALQDIIGKTTVLMAMEGKDTAEIDQLNLNLSWYREVLLRIGILRDRLTENYLHATFQKQQDTSTLPYPQIISSLDEFDFRLQTLTTFAEEIRTFGEKFTTDVQQYKDGMTAYYRELTIFQDRLQKMDDAQKLVLAAMEENDALVAQNSEKIKAKMAGVTRSTRISIMGLSGMIMLIVIAGWLSMRVMLKPLLELSRMAEQLADGDIRCDIHRLRRMTSADEIGILSRSFKKLIDYFQDMAATAAEISRGNVLKSSQPRSANDVLGYAFQNMSHYLQEIAAVAVTIAAGDLRQDIQPKTDEDVLGKAFQEMKSLRKSMSEIMNAAVQLSSAAEELDRISSQMAVSTTQTSEQVQIVSSNSRHISENVDAVAVSTEEMSANIQAISKNTDKVAQVVKSAVERAAAANLTIGDLAKRSQEIGEIITVITAVTDQTNLLALNATIEAARAGDAGRGFSVVATEIKALSRETAASTENIIRKLEAIQTSSADATAAITEISNIITQIRDLAESTAISVEQQSGATHDIAHRMADAAHGSQGITQIISTVALAAQNTSHGAVDVQNAAKDLAALAESLQQLVAQFKV